MQVRSLRAAAVVLVGAAEPSHHQNRRDWVAARCLSWGAAVWLRLFPHARELQGLSRTTGVPVAKLALVQLVYEATSACTSVVVQNRCPSSSRACRLLHPPTFTQIAAIGSLLAG